MCLPSGFPSFIDSSGQSPHPPSESAARARAPHRAPHRGHRGHYVLLTVNHRSPDGRRPKCTQATQPNPTEPRTEPRIEPRSATALEAHRDPGTASESASGHPCFEIIEEQHSRDEGEISREHQKTVCITIQARDVSCCTVSVANMAGSLTVCLCSKET